MKTESLNKYQNGKIYTIRSPYTEFYYIGSTCQPLSKRFYEHRINYDRYFKKYGSYPRKKHWITSFHIFQQGECYIELLENYACNNRDELIRREGELIRLNKDKIINKNDPYVSVSNKVICECGGSYMKNYMKSHVKTLLHIHSIQTQEEPVKEPEEDLEAEFQKLFF
jgi:hypothetical protein